MIGDIYEYKDLKKFTRGANAKEVVARLIEMDIDFKRKGKRGLPWTTIQAINAAISQNNKTQSEKKPGELIINIK